MLERKVAELEKELAHSRRTESAPRAATADFDEATSMQPRHNNHNTTGKQAHSSMNHEASVELSDEEAIVDTLATTAFSHEPEISIGHFGPSSNHGYFRALSNIFAHLPEDGSAANPKSLHHWSRHRPIPGHSSSPEVSNSELCNPAILPDASTAMFLFNQFFMTMSLSAPYMSRAATLRNYNQAHDQSAHKLTQVRRALFNILWAHGAAADGRAGFEIFYRRAMRCLNSLTIREAGDEWGRQCHPWHP